MLKKTRKAVVFIMLMLIISSCSTIESLNDYQRWLLSADAEDYNGDAKINEIDYAFYLNSNDPEITFTVTFDSDGGTVVQNQTVPYLNQATRPQDPTKIGYHFMGWFRDQSYTSEFNFSKQINGNFTLYAKWLSNFDILFDYVEKYGDYSSYPTPNYSITFNLNDDKSTSYRISVTSSTQEIIFTLDTYERGDLFSIEIFGTYGHYDTFGLFADFPGLGERYTGLDYEVIYDISANVLLVNFDIWGGPSHTKSSSENLADILVSYMLIYMKENVFAPLEIPFA